MEYMTKNRAVFVLIGTLLWPQLGFSQINKCDVGGKIIYQQEPCARTGGTGGELKVVIPSGGSEYFNSPELERLRQDHLKAQRELDLAIANHCAEKKFDKPIVGMSESDLSCIKRYRKPEKINVTTTALGESKQFVFRDHGRSSYLYFKNGKLETIQGEQ